MSLSLDDVDQKSNELEEQAVWATELNVDMQSDLTVRVELVGEKDLHGPISTFPVSTPDIAPEIHRRVFSTLARIVGGNGVPNVIGVSVKLPRGVDGRNNTRTAEMAPFLQSIADSSTIQRFRSSARHFSQDTARMTGSSGIDATEPTDAVRLFLAAAVNLASPQSVLKKLYLHEIHFDNELLATLCGSLLSRECGVAQFELWDCRFPMLGPLWLALAVNQSILDFYLMSPECEEEASDDNYGTQELRSMLQTNTTMKELGFSCSNVPFPNSFFTGLGAGLVSNSTLTRLELSATLDSEEGYLTALFENGLDCNTGIEKLCLDVNDLSDTQDVVLGLDQMAKNVSTRRHADGSSMVSTLKSLRLSFGLALDLDEVGCVKLVLDCLIHNSTYFALEELSLDGWGRNPGEDHAGLFVKLAAFIQAFPTATALWIYAGSEADDDSKLLVLADTLENNTTMTRLEAGNTHVTGDSCWGSNLSPADNPNRTRVLCSIVRNRRELPLFVESSKRSLLPLVLRRVLKPTESEMEKVVNLNHAFHLIQNLPELFSS